MQSGACDSSQLNLDTKQLTEVVSHCLLVPAERLRTSGDIPVDPGSEHQRPEQYLLWISSMSISFRIKYRPMTYFLGLRVSKLNAPVLRQLRIRTCQWCVAVVEADGPPPGTSLRLTEST